MCSGTTKAGSRCKLNAVPGTNYCRNHGEVVVESNVDIVAISEINTRIAAMKEEIASLKKIKRGLGNKNKVLNKAKLLFYHEHKKDAAILNNLRGALRSSNLYLVKKDKEIIPWTFVKACTDELFSKLSKDDQEAYIQLAQEALSCV